MLNIEFTPNEIDALGSPGFFLRPLYHPGLDINRRHFSL
jgi:hypothetical protein